MNNVFSKYPLEQQLKKILNKSGKVLVYCRAKPGQYLSLFRILMEVYYTEMVLPPFLSVKTSSRARNTDLVICNDPASSYILSAVCQNLGNISFK